MNSSIASANDKAEDEEMYSPGFHFRDADIESLPATPTPTDSSPSDAAAQAINGADGLVAPSVNLAGVTITSTSSTAGSHPLGPAPAIVLDQLSTAVFAYTGGEARQLRQLPARRILNLRTKQSPTALQAGRRRPCLIAGIAQIVGVKANGPCEKCGDGSGPFQSCVTVPGTRAPVRGNAGKPFLLGACANCFYADHGKDCSFRA